MSTWIIVKKMIRSKTIKQTLHLKKTILLKFLFGKCKKKTEKTKNNRKFKPLLQTNYGVHII